MIRFIQMVRRHFMLHNEVDKMKTDLKLLEREVESLRLEDAEFAGVVYELMIAGDFGVEIAMFAIGQHSRRFSMIQRWYNKGFWTADMVADAVDAGWITEEERVEIVGE